MGAAAPAGRAGPGGTDGLGGGRDFWREKVCVEKVRVRYFTIFFLLLRILSKILPLELFPNELESCGRAPPLCMFPLRTIKKIPQGMINNHSLGNTRIDTRVSYAHTDHQACFRLKLNR